MTEPSSLPWTKVAFLTLAWLCFTYQVNCVWPFAPRMVVDFGSPPEEVGWRVGLLATSYFAGFALSNYPWGVFTDRVGRRPAILIGVLGTGLANVWFGCSSSYWEAFAARFVAGSCNAIAVGTRTYMSDITDDTNQAKGFAFFAVGFGLGSIIGPTAGGTLAHPAEKYAFLHGVAFFVRFPYCIPMFLGAFLCAVSFVGTLLFLPETEAFKDAARVRKERAVNVTSVVDDLEENLLRGNETSSSSSSPLLMIGAAGAAASGASDASEDCVAEYTNFIDARSHLFLSFAHDKVHSRVALNSSACPGPPAVSEGEGGGLIATKMSNSSVGAPPAPGTNPVLAKGFFRSLLISESPGRDGAAKAVDSLAGVASPTVLELLRTQRIAACIVSYALIRVAVVSYDEALPLFAHFEEARGGLGMSTTQIGAMLALGGLYLIFYQIVLFPRLVHALGLLRTFWFGVVGFGVYAITVPSAHFVYYGVDRMGLGATWTTVLYWVWLGLQQICKHTFVESAFTSGMALAGNSAAHRYRGRVIGLQVFAFSMLCSIGPISVGALWSWSTTLGNPEQTFLAFGVVTLFAAVSFATAVCMPSSLNSPID